MKNINDAIFDFAYEYALRDATLRTKALEKQKGTPEKSKMLDIIRDISNKDVNGESAKGICREYVNYVLTSKGNVENQDEFDKSFLSYAKRIKDKFDGKMTFGNIQKLMNMTVKYISIREYTPETKEHLDNCFKYCHCPMDRIMRDKAIQYDNDNNIKIKNKLTKKTSWSALDCTGNEYPQEYKEFQDIIKKAVGEGVSPLEFDYLNWGKASKDKEIK